jgi:hypothetical protein
MEIIDEFEKEKRGAAYAGAVGYFAADGSMDTCIVLRTALVKDGTMYVQAGGGVVADSQPEAEYQETINKSKALLAAAEEAVRFASAAKKEAVGPLVIPAKAGIHHSLKWIPAGVCPRRRFVSAGYDKKSIGALTIDAGQLLFTMHEK